MSQKKIGAKIVIDGEQEFRSALQQSKNALKEFDSELKLVSSEFKKNENSMDALKAKQAVYQKQQRELAKQSKLLVDQIKKASEEYKKAADAQKKQADKIKQLEKALEQAKKQYGDSADEVKQLEQELSEANEEYAKQDRAITALSNKITKWNTDLNNTKRELNETDDALEDTNKAIEDYDTNLDRAEAETKEFGMTMGTAGDNTEKLRVSLGSLVSAQVVVDVLRNCARAIKEVATAAIDVGAKFEASMSKVEALSGASGDSLERLTAKAKEMGASTIYSASESADAFSYMALAGWKVEEMLEGIEPVLHLAASANMDLAEASDIVTDYITAFGLKADDAAHFADAMATAMSTSNTTVEQLGEAYKNVAATCGSMGIAMEDATAVLATMANAGVKGAEAGTALNSILTRIATNTNGAADKLKEYGVAVYDAEGNMNSISSILNGVADAWGDLSQEEQAALAKTVAGVRQYSKFQTIMLGVSDAAKEGGQSFDDYAQALRDCDGAAEAMAKTMQDNLTGDITILKSALEGLGIATEGVFDDAFREAVQGATDAIADLEHEVSYGELGVSLSELGDSIAELTENLVDAASDALPGFVDGLTWLIDHLGDIKDVLVTAGASMVAYKVATLAATIATEGFTTALKANPIGLAAAALTTLTVSVIEYSKSVSDISNYLSEEDKETIALAEDTRKLNETIRASMSERAGEAAQMDAQAGAARRLVAELFNEQTTRGRQAQIIGELKSLYPQLNIAIDEQGKLIGASREQLEKYIDVSLQAAKVEAAKEHLTEIAKQQFEAEQRLEEIQRQRTDAVLELKKAENDHSTIEMEAAMNIEAAKEALVELDAEQAEARDTVEELGDEYQRTLDYIENNEPIDEAAESAEALAAAEVQATNATAEFVDAEGNAIIVTDEMAKEFEELEQAIANSISSSLDLTNRWSQEWTTSTDEMRKNVDSQIEGIENWSKNFDKLANNAEVNIDQRVLKYIADMGTEGAGLVQELVNTLEKSPEELKAFSDSMAQYLSLEDSVAQKVTDSYVDAVTKGTESAADALADSNGAMAEAAETMHDDIAAQMTNVGHDAVAAVGEAFEEGADEVSQAAEKSGESALDGVKDALGENGEKAGEVAEAADEAMASAFENGKAKEAALTASQEIYNNFAQNLSEEQGYAIGEGFMGGMYDAVHTLGEQVIEAAAAMAEEAKRLLRDIPPAGGGGPGNTPPGFAEGLDYVPYDNFLARLHEGERVLTKEENAQYMALLGDAKAPSFTAVQARSGDLGDGRAVVINNDIRVDGAQDPEAWTQTFIRTLKREARMA